MGLFRIDFEQGNQVRFVNIVVEWRTISHSKHSYKSMVWRGKQKRREKLFVVCLQIVALYSAVPHRDSSATL